MTSLVSVDAEPEAIAIAPERTALVIIDMQRDFLEPGGFGETLGNDVSLLKKAVEPCRALLALARRIGMPTRPAASSNAARRRCASARRDRWGAS
jgi:isochorismate hydrolase